MTQPAQNASSPGTEAEGDGIAEGLQAPALSHPTWRQLREFMQLLLREFLLAASNPKQWLPLEVLLEVSWKGCFRAVCCGNRPARTWAPQGQGMPRKTRRWSFWRARLGLQMPARWGLRTPAGNAVVRWEPQTLARQETHQAACGQMGEGRA